VKAKPGRVYYLKDHLGSVRTSVDENGHVIGYDDYYPFGLTMLGRSSNTGNPNDNYKFTGHELDDEANLNIYYMIARGYDPVLGRFMQIDPVFDLYPDQSPYNYALNNPVFNIDPTGLCPEGFSKGDIWDPGDGSGPTLCGPEAEVTATQLPMQLTINHQRPNFFGVATAQTVAIAPAASVDGLVPLADIGVTAGALTAYSIALYKALTFESTEVVEVMLSSTDVTIDGTDIVLPKDPTVAPGEDWEWRGTGEVGSREGAWVNPKTGETLHNDLDHPPGKPPHWGYKDKNGNHWDVNPNTGAKTPTPNR